jgi:hypothetical protein
MTYDPFRRVLQRAQVQRSQLWTLEKNGRTYSCELRSWDDGRAEACILEDGEMIVSRRFECGWQTLQWAEEKRKYWSSASSREQTLKDAGSPSCSRFSDVRSWPHVSVR